MRGINLVAHNCCSPSNQPHVWLHAICATCAISHMTGGMLLETDTTDYLHSYNQYKICLTEIIVKNAEMRECNDAMDDIDFNRDP